MFPMKHCVSPCVPQPSLARTCIRNLAICATVAGVCIVLLAAQWAQAGGPQAGLLRFGLSQEPDSLDPTLSRTYSGRVLLTQLCERLYDLDANGSPVPQLAAALPETSAGGRVHIIRLRPNLRFNDGTAFNAQAVKTTLDRFLTQKGSMRRTELGPVIGVDVVDALTVRLRLDRPYAPLLVVLSDRAGMILSPSQLSRLGDRFESEPVCIGPWQFAQQVPGKKIVLERSPFYRGASPTTLQRVVFKPIPDSGQRLAALRNGEVDMINGVPPLEIAALRADPRFGVTQVLGPGYVGITFNIANRSGRTAGPANLDTPWARQAKVREAFDLSLDRVALNQQALGGEYVPGCTPISPATPLHPNDHICPKRDIAAAKKLLAEAGYPDGLSLDLLIVDDVVQLRVGQTIQAMAKDAGILVRLKPAPFQTVIAQQEKGQFEALLLGFAGRLDPDSVIFPFHTCHGSLNFSLACDPTLDRLLLDAQGQTDVGERQKTYAKAIGRILQNHVIVYLFHQKYTVAYSRRVSGLEAPPDGLLRLANVRVGNSVSAISHAARVIKVRSL
jgi:peptide/nickel transport system substrate-binding protein